MGGYITSEGRVLQVDEYVEALEDALIEFVEWFDARFPEETKSKDLPGLTLFCIAEKSRKLVG